MRLCKRAIGSIDRLDIKRRANGRFILRQYYRDGDQWELTQVAEFDYYHNADKAFNREIRFYEIKGLPVYRHVINGIAW